MRLTTLVVLAGAAGLAGVAEVAGAAELAVHADPPELESRLTALGFGDVPRRHVRDLVAEAPPRLLSGGIVPCAPQPTTDLAAALEAARAAVQFGDRKAAWMHLHEAAHLLDCPLGPFDADVAGAVFRLRGELYFADGDPTGAHDAFVRAHLVRPGLAPTGLADDVAAVFRAAEQELYADEPARLVLPPEPPVLIDGRSKPGRVVLMPPGPHLLAKGDRTWQILLPRGESTLAFPPIPDLGLADRPSTRPQLDEALSWSLPSGAEILVITDAHLYETRVGSLVWTDLEANAAAHRIRSGRQRSAGWKVAAAGGGIAVSGGVLALASLVQGRAIADHAANEAADQAEWEADADRYRRQQVLLGVAWGVTGVGLGVGSAGVVWAALPGSIAVSR